MDAKETIEYLYEHGHIVSFEHYKTICDALNKPIAEHPDVQRLVGQVVELQAENERFRGALEEIAYPPQLLSLDLNLKKSSLTKCQWAKAVLNNTLSWDKGYMIISPERTDQ